MPLRASALATLLIQVAAVSAKQADAITSQLSACTCKPCQDEVPVLADALLAIAASARTAVALILRLQTHTTDTNAKGEPISWPN